MDVEEEEVVVEPEEEKIVQIQSLELVSIVAPDEAEEEEEEEGMAVVEAVREAVVERLSRS